MEQKNYLALLTKKQYLKLLLADLINRFGDSLDTVAYSWIMYEVTGSASLMALVVGLNFLPTVILMPLAGVVVDRLNKKRVMIISDIIRFCIVGLIVILYTGGNLNAFIIAFFTLLTSAVEAFRIPAGGAILPMLLEKDYFTLGKAANYSGSRMAELLGYVLAGLITTQIGASGALCIDAVTFLLSACIIGLIQYRDEKPAEIRLVYSVFSDFTEGLSFVKTTKAVRTVALVGLLINFGIMPLFVFQTPYVSDYLKMGPTILSYIKILMILGMMIGAALLPKLHLLKKNGVVALSGMVMGLTLVIMSITPNISVRLIKMVALTISMFFIGVGGGMLNVVVGSTMMKAVPQDMMGRVCAFNAAIMQASMPIASFICSALALKFSVTQIFAVFGILTMLSYSVLYFMRKLEHLNM